MKIKTFLLLALLLLCASGTVRAQTRIEFARGKTSAIVSGGAKGGSYSFRARPGQRAVIKVAPAGFTFWSGYPGAGSVECGDSPCSLPGAFNTTGWSGVLPPTGETDRNGLAEYEISVTPQRRSRATNFTLSVFVQSSASSVTTTASTKARSESRKPSAIAQRRCEQTTNSTPDYNECIDRVYQVADRDLNNTYRQVMRELSDNDRAHVRAAQRQWIERRDRACKPLLTSGGSGAPAFYDQCALDVTITRIDELKKLLK